MKTKYLLLGALVVVLGSCSSAYRTGQTPDDVYFSPAPAEETYVIRGNSDRNSYYIPNSEEREIRRAIRDPRYRAIVSYNVGYGYNPYMYNPYAYNNFSPFGYNYGYSPYGFNNFYGKGFYDPYGYNPFYPSYGSPFYPSYGNYYPGYGYMPIVVGKQSNNQGARRYNLGAYGNSPALTPVPQGKTGVINNRNTAPVRTFGNTSPSTQVNKERTGVGNSIRRVFTPSERRQYTPPANNNNRSNTRPARTNPVRTFDPPARNSTPPARSFDPPTRSVSPPPASSNNSRSSSPVRTFRNN